MGTSEFAVPILEKLIKNYQIIGVFTQSDKPLGRNKELAKSPVKELALKNNLTIFQPQNLKEQNALNQIKELSPDLIVVVAYGKIIPQNIIKIPKYGVINIHGSLLPEYRGASPIQTAILNGGEKTGVTIMLIDEKMDHGPVLAKQELGITNNDTTETLSKKLSVLGADLLIKILPDYLSGKMKPTEQNHEQATFTKITTREDGQIDWFKSAEEIERQWRAFTPWPGIFTFWDGKRLKLNAIRILNTDNNPAQDIGKVFLIDDDNMGIYCGKGSLILEKLQLEGKKELTGQEFRRGYKNIIGAELG
ncbi:MAG: methionyl-tRNA formyltransferase [Patescibacteria group bacterium]|nr:methionyl-tRNA formyltransferase [Patescibacteria group bacterium]MDD5490483.1 methionyl-tRNA formyltransferase [Patescibacteria group bacterium]